MARRPPGSEIRRPDSSQQATRANRLIRQVSPRAGEGNGQGTDRFYRGKADDDMYAADMLGMLGLPEDLIDEVCRMLAARAEELEGARPSPIGDVFGGSAQGGLLSHHASVARDHVADAVLQMAAGLRGFRDELGSHVARMDYVDTQNALDLARIGEAAARVAAPYVGSNDEGA